VGKSGVTLDRDLNNISDISDNLANNDDPAVKFTYRPDFVVNAPKGFQRTPVVWKEVAPRLLLP
jgi:hypothetical protein